MLFVKKASKHYHVTIEIVFICYCVFTCRLCCLLCKKIEYFIQNVLLLYRFHLFNLKILTSVYFKILTQKCKSYVLFVFGLDMKSYIRLGDNNENQCFPYSCIVSAAIEFLKSEQILREAKCVSLHYIDIFQCLSRVCFQLQKILVICL